MTIEVMKEESKTQFELVGEFHKKFGFPIAGDDNLPHLLSDRNQEDIAEFRLKFLKEELQEFEDAQAEGDLVGIADALVDLVYVALGTAHYYGLPFDELFDEVQRSNMEKIRVERAEQSKRGAAWDVRKPEGWKPPNLGRILAAKIVGYQIQDDSETTQPVETQVK